MNRKSNYVLKLVAVGLMSALVCAASYLQIKIQTPVGVTRIHFGNIMCVLSGLLFGSVTGGLSAGIGSGLYDLFDPLYIASAPFTFAFKFCIGFFAGLISHPKGEMTQKRQLLRDIVGGVVGSLGYVILYVGKSFVEAYFFERVEWQTALISVGMKAATSTINAVLAVVIAVPLAQILRRALSPAWKHLAPQEK